MSEQPVYIYRSAEKTGLALVSLRQRLFPRRNLFAGPYAGEFGYEVMQFQGYVRARRRYYKQVHVLTFPGREYLYEGCQVHAHELNLKTAGFWYGRLGSADMKKIAENKAREVGLEDYDVFNPSLLCTQYHKRVFWHQEFQLLQEPPLAPKLYDLVFHLRAINKAGPGPSKNYPPAKAEQLARRCLDSGLSVCCIGHPEYSYCPAGCADYRNIDLRQTVAGICSGRLGVGGSSGAMHLINVCGKPTVTWGDPAALRWNPFLVPIHMLGDTAWQPDPDEVHRAVLIAFEELRQKTFQFTRPAYTLPGRQISPI